MDTNAAGSIKISMENTCVAQDTWGHRRHAPKQLRASPLTHSMLRFAKAWGLNCGCLVQFASQLQANNCTFKTFCFLNFDRRLCSHHTCAPCMRIPALNHEVQNLDCGHTLQNKISKKTTKKLIEELISSILGLRLARNFPRRLQKGTRGEGP